MLSNFQAPITNSCVCSYVAANKCAYVDVPPALPLPIVYSSSWQNANIYSVNMLEEVKQLVIAGNFWGFFIAAPCCLLLCLLLVSLISWNSIGNTPEALRMISAVMLPPPPPPPPTPPAPPVGQRCGMGRGGSSSGSKWGRETKCSQTS